MKIVPANNLSVGSRSNLFDCIAVALHHPDQNTLTMLFASSENKPIKVKYLHPNKVGHAMIHNFKGLKQAPQSPLMSCQEKQKRRSRNTPLHKPVTTKITSTPPLTDFYWGKHITKATPLTPRMKSLQKVFGLDYCKSTKISPESCLLHCQWATYLRQDLRDDESALEFYKFSANMGHVRSMKKLAVMLLYGHGAPSSPKRAKYYFMNLLQYGSDHITTTYYNCVCALGTNNQIKQPGVPIAADTVKEAISKMKASLTKGIAYHLDSPWTEVFDCDEKEIKTCMAAASLVLGRHILRKGQQKDEALKWLIEAAKMGSADAMCAIGDAFTFQTSGTVQNIPLARKYYSLASALGNKKAQRRIDSLVDWE